MIFFLSILQAQNIKKKFYSSSVSGRPQYGDIPGLHDGSFSDILQCGINSNAYITRRTRFGINIHTWKPCLAQLERYESLETKFHNRTSLKYWVAWVLASNHSIVLGRHGDAEWSEREINIAPPPTPIDEPSASEWEDATSSPAPPPPPPEPATLKELTKPEVYKPLLIMIGFLFFQQFSGVYVVIAYMVDIIRAAGVVTVSPYWLTVVGGAVILAVSILASVVYPKTGVRAIATLSGLGTAITMFWIGIYLSIRPLWINSDSWYFLHWVPVFIILSNIALSTAGFLILPWSMLGEVICTNSVSQTSAYVASLLSSTIFRIMTVILQFSTGVPTERKRPGWWPGNLCRLHIQFCCS